MFRYSFIIDSLIKAMTHKYIRRIPKGVTKTGKTKYMYFYAGQEGRGKGIAHEHELIQGASFAMGNGDQRHHAHITKEEGDKVTVKYDDGAKKGQEETMTKKEFQALVHGEHKEAIKQVQEKQTQREYKQKQKKQAGPDLKKPHPAPPKIEHEKIKIKRAQTVTKIVDTLASMPSLEDQLKAFINDNNSDALSKMLEKLGVQVKPKIDNSRQNSFIMLAGEAGKPTKAPIKYKIVEMDDIQASHDENTFTNNKEYPTGLQERIYESDMAEQLKVIRNAQNLEPAFLVNTNPDAMNGAPIINEEGLVLGGNSRTMAIKRAYARHPEKAETYKNYLADHADSFGFAPEYISQFKNPILVREYDPEDKSEKNMKLLVRQMNEGFTQSMDEKTEIAAISRRLTDKSINAIGKAFSNSDAANIYELLNLGDDYSQDVINALMKDGILSYQNMNKYIDVDTKRVSPAFAHMLSDVLVGKVLTNKTIMAKMSPALHERFSAGVISLVALNLFDEKQRHALEHAIYAYSFAQKTNFVRTRGTAEQNLSGLQNWISQGKTDTGKGDIEDKVRSELTNNPLALAYLETLGIATTASKLRDMFSAAGAKALGKGADQEVDLFGETASMEKELKKLNDFYMPGKTQAEKDAYKLKKSMKSKFSYTDLVKSLRTKK